MVINWPRAWDPGKGCQVTLTHQKKKKKWLSWNILLTHYVNNLLQLVLHTKAKWLQCDSLERPDSEQDRSSAPPRERGPGGQPTLWGENTAEQNRQLGLLGPFLSPIVSVQRDGGKKGASKGAHGHTEKHWKCFQWQTGRRHRQNKFVFKYSGHFQSSAGEKGMTFKPDCKRSIF